jgi:NADH-quinone oxidoreductase subunit C
MSQKVVDALKRQFPQAVTATHALCGDHTVILGAAHLVPVCRFLKEDPAMAFDMPVDVTAVDYQAYPGGPPHGTRFVAVYHLRSMTHGHRICLKVPVPDSDLTVDSVTSVWKGVTWFEREAFDMLGVVFRGHPDLRRILMYPEFVGHPLRKDYPLRGYQPRMPMPTLSGDPVPGLGGSDEE